MFNATPKEDRTRMLAEEAEQTRIRRKRERIEAKGYTWEDGRVGNLGGYGVALAEDGTLTVGDPELGETFTTQLAGAHAALETLEQARDRVTAGRLVAFGLLALAIPKRDRRRVLVITGAGGFEAVVVVDGTTEPHLRQFVASINRLGGGGGLPVDGRP